MGGESIGLETTTAEPQVGGNRLRVGDMSHTSAEAATTPLLPARCSFLMVDGDFVLPNSTDWSLVELSSVRPTNPALPSIYSYTIHPSVVRHNLSMLTLFYFPQFLLSFAVVFGYHFLLHQYLTLTPSGFIHSP